MAGLSDEMAAAARPRARGPPGCGNSGGIGSVLPGGGGTGDGSRGGPVIVMTLSLIKECPPVGGHSLMLRTRSYSSCCGWPGLLARLLIGLFVRLLILTLLLLALLALALLLVTVLRGLLRVAVLGIVHR